MSFLGIVFRSIGETALNEGDALRCYEAHSAADGCAGFVALDLVGLTGAD